LVNPPGSARCDCGWDFETSRQDGVAAISPGRATEGRRLHTLALLALVVIWGPFVWLLREGIRPADMLVAAIAVTLPFLVPPLIVLAQPRAGASLRGLAAASSTSALLAAYAALLLFVGLVPRPPLWPGSASWQLSLLLVVLAFGALWASARKALQAGGTAHASSGCLPALGLSVVCFLTGSVFAFAVLGRWARQTANENATVALLRTIGRAEARYSAELKCGYPETLAVLDLGDVALAAKVKDGPTFLKNSYTLEYHPGPPARSAAAGCTRGVESIAVTARPLAFGVDGRSSFFMDETEAIHHTSSDRPANAADPIVSR
jgi:hypothetical protein